MRVPIAGLLLCLAATAGSAEDRYLIFNRAPWRPGEDWWDQNHPHSIGADKFRQVKDGLDVPGNPDLRIGVSFVFSILDSATGTLRQCLQNAITASEETDTPMMVVLDAYTWWEGRPDLWNWWDPSIPGYNPENVYNVEWTDWTPDSAVKIGWRNWGFQFRVRPCPNLSSPAVVNEGIERLRALVPLLADWYRDLPEDRRHLFAGLKVGWEVGIGYNHWYYPEGNTYLERWPDDPSNDPQEGLQLGEGWPCGMPKLGYAAVKTAGIRDSGDLTAGDVSLALQRYLARLSEEAARLGIPRDRLFTHMGGNYEPWDRHFPFWPAVNAHSHPGYSFYGHIPEEAAGLAEVLDASPELCWGAAEWFHWAPTAQGWRDNLAAQLSFRNCRFVNVYNWEEFRKYPAALEGTALLMDSWRAPLPASHIRME